MTDNDAVQGSEVRLPESTEELQRMLREAFCQGAAWIHQRANAGCLASKEAARRYPIRKKVRRVVELDGAEVWASTDEDGDVGFYDNSVCHTFDVHGVEYLNPKDIAILADLIARPFDEVDE